MLPSAADDTTPAITPIAGERAFVAACEPVIAGRVEEGIEALLALAEAPPQGCAVAQALGTAYRLLGDDSSAREWFTRAVTEDPGDLNSWKDLAQLSARAGAWPEVAWACSNRVRRKPASADAWLLWGHALRSQRRIRSALSVFLRGWRHCPDHARLNAGIGTIYSELGKSHRGLDFLRRAVTIDPDFAEGWTNLLFAITGDDRSDGAAQAAEHKRFGALHAASPGTPKCPRMRRSNASARIRVGYVSSDFRRHPLERFYEPVLRNHDRRRFEVFAYSGTERCDASTERYRSWCDEWRDIANTDDETAWKAILRDELDILIDLSGQTRGNRLGVFARRGAPVQISHCGYPNTTGLSQMDWFLTDSRADPAGAGEHYFSEGLLRIDPCFLCYSPAAVPPLPDAHCHPRSRPVTFGCFNPTRKLSGSTLDLWARVLGQTPSSHLVLKARATEDPGVAARLRKEFSRRGIAPGRIECLAFSTDDLSYLDAYHEMDIALDPFPYNGATVTCDALWMGVPVVAKTGETHASRVAATLLDAGGFPECVAGSSDEYVRIATDLASDVAGLRSSRGSRRTRMMNSVLMDAPSYIRRFEMALGGVLE